MCHSLKRTGRTILLLIIASVAQAATSDCPRLGGRDLEDTGSLSLVSLALPTNATQPELLNYTILCIAQADSTAGTGPSRTLSGVAQNETDVFHFRCDCTSEDQNTTLQLVNTTELVLAVSNATSDEESRADCSLCLSPDHLPEADNLTSSCVSYASECNGTALLRCSLQESSDCCTIFGPDDQCSANGSCPINSTSNQESSECICSSNYNPGSECNTDVDACENNPCENGGNCTSFNGSFMCDCPVGYVGSTCNIDVNVCMNGGVLLYTDRAVCNCTEGWGGQYCDVCTLEGCVNCTASENESFAAACVQCESEYQLENETCIRLVDCSVEGCVSCSNTSIDVCVECEDGFMISQDGSNCSLLTTEAPSTFEGSTTIDDRTTTEVAEPFITTSRLIGIVVGSVIGGVLIILLAAILVCAVVYRRKKSRVTLTFDMNTIKATHITANPAFEDIGREDSGIENDDEITVNRAALEFDDS